MSNGPASNTVVAIILGAQDFELAGLGSDPAFERSARAMKDYLTRPSGLAIRPQNLLDLFDDDGDPNEINHSIRSFLAGRTADLASRGLAISDLLLFYTGHGAFGTGDDYVLTLRSTEKQNVAANSYRVADLAVTLKTECRSVRRYVILDCCFAAAAYQYFQTSVAEVASRQALSAFAPGTQETQLPGRGTALLCAAAHDRGARRSTSQGATRSGKTLFSECLLEVLDRGLADVPRPHLTLREVGEATQRLMHMRFAEEGPRPEVKSPDEREGDVASVPLFLNAALAPRLAPDDSVPKPNPLRPWLKPSLLLVGVAAMAFLAIRLGRLRESIIAPEVHPVRISPIVITETGASRSPKTAHADRSEATLSGR